MVAEDIGQVYVARQLEETGLEASVVAILGKDTKEEVRQQVAELLRGFVDSYPKWRFAVPNHVSEEKERELSDDHQSLLRMVEPPSVLLAHRNRRLFTLDGLQALQNKEQLALFFENVKQGVLRPTYKSEPLPSRDKDDDGCLILTGRTFADHALDPRKNVLVLFTPAIESPKSKAFSNAFIAVAQLLKAHESVVCATMDGQKNECEEEMDEIPKMVLYPAVLAKKKMIKRQVYRGLPEAEAMLDFTLENSKSPRRDDL